MSNPSKSLLEEQIALLVKHFGRRRVQAAIAKLVGGKNTEAPAPTARPNVYFRRLTGPPISNALGSIRDAEPQKYDLLSDFLVRLRARQILPEAEDIRYFAQSLGLKEIRGKSRKDMIPTLMRFLIDRDTDTLRVDIQHAATISQQERSQGFSVLTDKLVGQNDPRR